MANLTGSLTKALYAMNRETEHLYRHAVNLVSSVWDAEQAGPGQPIDERGVTGNFSSSQRSLGRSRDRRISGLLENRKDTPRFNSGIELAIDMVHLVNVQHNFDANAKTVSTIDTMMDTILNLRV